MKTRVQKEIGMTESWELPVFSELNQPQPSACTLSEAVYVGRSHSLGDSFSCRSGYGLTLLDSQRPSVGNSGVLRHPALIEANCVAGICDFDSVVVGRLGTPTLQSGPMVRSRPATSIQLGLLLQEH